MKKQIDKRIIEIIKHCLNYNKRSVCIILGDRGKDIVAYLYQIYQKISDKSE